MPSEDSPHDGRPRCEARAETYFEFFRPDSTRSREPENANDCWILPVAPVSLG